jgi:hypothetical protein
MLPVTLEITVATPSMNKSALFVPVTEEPPIEAEVPVKVNDTPVPGQVSSKVAGLTRPRYRILAAVPVELELADDDVVVFDVEVVVFSVVDVGFDDDVVDALAT